MQVMPKMHFISHRLRCFVVHYETKIQDVVWIVMKNHWIISLERIKAHVCLPLLPIGVSRFAKQTLKMSPTRKNMSNVLDVLLSMVEGHGLQSGVFTMIWEKP